MKKELETKRLKLRYFEKTDLEFLIELLGDDQVCRYLPGNKGYREDVINRILDYYMETTKNNKYQNIYLVSDKATGKPLGYSGIQIVQEFKLYEIFYAFIPEAWHKGYATEVSLAMKALARRIGLKKVIALADIENIASNRVLEKTGYERIKQLRLWELDMYYYEMDIL